MNNRKLHKHRRNFCSSTRVLLTQVHGNCLCRLPMGFIGSAPICMPSGVSQFWLPIAHLCVLVDSTLYSPLLHAPAMCLCAKDSITYLLWNFCRTLLFFSVSIVFYSCLHSFDCRVQDYWEGYKLFCYAYYSHSSQHEAEFRNCKLGSWIHPCPNCANLCLLFANDIFVAWV